MELAAQIAPRLLNRATSTAALTIIVPDDDHGQAVGRDIAEQIKRKWNSEIRVERSGGVHLGPGWPGNALVIGNLGNNGHLAKLYALRLTYADAVYPGQGGYQLQTLVDPFGLGGNTIVLAAGDQTGLERGIDRLLQLIADAHEPQLPWLSEAMIAEQVEKRFPYGAAPSEADVALDYAKTEQIAAKLDPERLQFDPTLSLFAYTAQYGEYFQLTGHEAYGLMYRKLMLAYADFVNRYPQEAKDHLNDRKHMWGTGASFIAGWTVNEASPIFSGDERARIVSAIYLTFAANDRDGYLNRLPDYGARFNHDTFPALSLIYGASYFMKYHQDDAAAGWYAKGERVFSGNTSNITLDEGSDYLMHVPTSTLDYAFVTGDRRFLTQGLRPSADLQALMIDNLGTMSGGGDVYPFGRSSAYSWGHSAVLNAASWFYNEPLYQFLLERTRTGPFPNQNMDDLKRPFHRYATDKVNARDIPKGAYPLVQACRVEQGVYDDLYKKPGAPRPDVPQAETVHKLAFRQGLETTDSYLMLDGFAAGKHNQHDANTIIKYSANGRIFIDDRDYIERGPEHHSGIIVVKDGEQPQKPPLSRLKWMADADGIGVSRMELPGDNGADWDRTVLTPGGRFYLIYDELHIREDGRYLFENTWQTLGKLAIRPDRFEVEQQGVTMTIHSLDESELRSYSRYGHFIKYWKRELPYPYADEENVLRQVLEERPYRQGDKAGYVHVLSSRAAGEQAVEAVRLNEHTVRLTDTDTNWLAVNGPIRTDRVTSDGKLHLLSDQEALIAEVRRVQFGMQTFAFDQPVILRLDFRSNEWKAYSLTYGVTAYDERGELVREGRLQTGTFSVAAEELQQLLQVLAVPGRIAQKRPAAALPSSERKPLFRFEQPITSAALGDLNDDGREELVIAGSQGGVAAVDEKGRLLWSFDSGGRVNEVTVQPLAGKPVVFIATENWLVYALDGQGREIWRYAFPSDPAHSESKGNLLGVTNVRVAYVNGKDEEPWVMVGTQFRYIYGLDPRGRLMYKDLAYYYGIEDMAFADLDGDGRDEGILGLEYAYFALVKDGKISNGPIYGPGWKVTDALVEWSGDTLPAVALGTKEHHVHLVQYRSNKLVELWRQNIGGEVNDVRHGDFDGDGVTEIVAGSGGFQFYVMGPDGAVRWRRTLNDRVLKVGGWRFGYLAAADNGRLYRLAHDGQLVESVTLGAGIVELLTDRPGECAWILLENGDVCRLSAV